MALIDREIDPSAPGGHAVPEAPGTAAEGAEFAVLAGHAAECPDCRVRVSQIKHLDALLRGPGRKMLASFHPSPEAMLTFAVQRAELAPDKIHAIETHLYSCAVCSREVALLEESQAISIEPEPRGTAETLPSAVREAIAESRKQSPTGSPRPFLPSARHLLSSTYRLLSERANPFIHPRAWAAAAAVGLILFAVLVVRSSKTPEFRIVARPVVIDDQTVAGRHGGRSSHARDLAESLATAYPELMEKLSTRLKTVRFDTPKGEWVRFGSTAERVGADLHAGSNRRPRPEAERGGRPLGAPTPKPQSEGLPTLQIQLTVAEGGLCFLSVSLHVGTQSPSVRTRENFPCASSLDRIEENVVDLIFELTPDRPEKHP